MSEIRVLSDNMINLVAAGEVVERPASVVKELIENSIDASATKIEIEIKNGGKKLIRISDNGNGISRNDIRLAFISHATSKISKESDLEKIATLGFRGEALASISSVSKIDLITSAPGESVGSSYKIEGGDEIFLKNCSLRNGTSIVVRDIFYNTPARMKFLKKDVTEGNYISSIVDHAILSHPEISFKFIRNGKLVVSSVGDGNLSSAILRVFGKDFFNSLIEVNYDLNNVRVKGFISDPLLSKSSSKMQNLFINGRWIKNKIVSNAIEASLSDEYQNNKVAFVLNLDVKAEDLKGRVAIRLNGIEYKTKGVMGYAIVKEYLKAHPNTTIGELKDVFHNGLLGRWGAWNFIEDNIEAARSLKEETMQFRHLLKDEYVLTSGDGVKFVVSNQWEKANVLNLLQIAKNEGWIYDIERQ